MDDFGPLIQYITPIIIALIGGAGLTGLYDAQVRRRERAVDRFCELVLTPVLFRYLSISRDAIHLFEVYDRVKKGESPTIYIEGVLVTVPDLKDWQRRFEHLRKEAGILTKKAADTGIADLAPEKIGNELSEIGTTMNEIQRKVLAEEDLFAIVKEGRDQLGQISTDIRKIVGTHKLGGYPYRVLLFRIIAIVIIAIVIYVALTNLTLLRLG